MGRVIINTGIMLERLTNGQIPIGWHRVVAAPGYEGERYSVVQFCHPARGRSCRRCPARCTPERRNASMLCPPRTRSTRCSTRSTSSKTPGAPSAGGVPVSSDAVPDRRRTPSRRRLSRRSDRAARPPSQLAPAILAIDVGGSRFEAGLVTTKGDLVDRAIIADRTRCRSGGTLRPTLAAIVEQQMSASRTGTIRVAAVGVACPGRSRSTARPCHPSTYPHGVGPAPGAGSRADGQTGVRRHRRQGVGDIRRLDGRRQGLRQLLRDHRVYWHWRRDRARW